MKPIQVMMDAALLSALDSTEAVQREGRSAVLRQAVTEYLRRERQHEIRTQYEQAYSGEAGLGDEFAGWDEQGSWPES